MSHIKTSTYLIFIGLVLFLINLWALFLVFQTIDNLRKDAQNINEAGIIRGLIQRVTKLEASNIDHNNQRISRVDYMLENIHRRKENINRPHTAEFYKYISIVEEHWQKMKDLYGQYHMNKSPGLRDKILKESEICWEFADNAVLQAQIITENKVLGIRIFYFILFIFGATTLVVIGIVFVFVRKKLEYQAAFDSLTGLMNRYSYDKYMEIEMERRQRYNHNLSVILIDLDHFKSINDTYGHKAGDETLRKVSGVMKESIRKTDAIFRIGGEEFAVVTPESSSEDAFHLAEKIRVMIMDSFIKNHFAVTVSLGISECIGEQKCSEIFREADEALYRAKSNGRNQVQVFKKPGG